jgi:hypothetical protein
VIVAVPFAFAVSKPAAVIVATDALDVLHVTVAPDITTPPASFTVATSVAVSANEAKLTLVCDSVTDPAACDTVTIAAALPAPEIAITAVVPSATAVTRPAADTVATAVFDDVHVTVGSSSTTPPASFTVATSVAVSANAVKLNTLGDNSRVAAMRTTEIESSFVAVCPSPVVTCRVNVLVPVVVGVPEIVSAESVSPSGSAPAEIDQL